MVQLLDAVHQSRLPDRAGIDFIRSVQRGAAGDAFIAVQRRGEIALPALLLQLGLECSLDQRNAAVSPNQLAFQGRRTPSLPNALQKITGDFIRNAFGSDLLRDFSLGEHHVVLVFFLTQIHSRLVQSLQTQIVFGLLCLIVQYEVEAMRGFWTEAVMLFIFLE